MLHRGTDRYWSRKLGEHTEKRSTKKGLFNQRTIEDLKKGFEQWKKDVYKRWTAESPELKVDFQTASGIPLRSVYTPLDVADQEQSKLSLPGVYPYPRGLYPTMHRGRLWTMRMFSGFGTPEDTNRRLRLLLEHGETGLSIAFDMPTLYGYDCDHPRSHGEVGRCGVNVSSMKDMEVIFDRIPLARVSTSMTINAPAAILTCMYAGVAKKRGIPIAQLEGTVQADMLKEYIAQKEWVTWKEPIII